MVEIWYCWRELATCEGEGSPRLFVPWADPYEHEFDFDFIYETPEKAKKAKEEMAPDEDWLLVKMTLETVEVPDGKTSA